MAQQPLPKPTVPHFTRRRPLRIWFLSAAETRLAHQTLSGAAFAQTRSPAPAPSSRASAVNSQDDASANGRSITSTRWNGHYLVPKGNTGTDDSFADTSVYRMQPRIGFSLPTPVLR